MKYKENPVTIEKIIKLKDSDLLLVNPEYQRGEMWELFQKKMFIDTILRGYPLPTIFLHKKTKTVPDLLSGNQETSTKYEIIDGQQRISAIYEYIHGEYELLDPANPEQVRFPNFMQKQPCDWKGERFDQLKQEFREQLLKTEISSIVIESEENSDNETRDLFIRLQAGSALNDQEKRDAWPGNFTNFILHVGGKEKLMGCVGNDFFPKIMNINRSTGRGTVRLIAAQMYKLYDSFIESRSFSSIKKEGINEFYRIHIDFDGESEKAKDFLKCLDILKKIFESDMSPKMKNHQIFHLLILVASLLKDSYVQKKWQHGLKEAHEEFSKKLAEAQTLKDDEERGKNEYWIHYGQYIRTNADNPEVMNRRHIFFIEKMSEYMREKGTLISQDKQRGFIEVERWHIYYRDEKKCLMCGNPVTWSDTEIHHIKPHSEGGKTVIENGALVHKSCHPKNQPDVKKAADLFEKQKTSRKQEAIHSSSKKKRQVRLPENTELRMSYNGQEHQGKIGSKGRMDCFG